MSIGYTLLAIFIGIIAVLGRVFFWNAGRTGEKLKQSEKVIENVTKAKKAADRAGDPVISNGLRKRYPWIK